MPENPSNRLRHIRIEGTASTEPYAPRGQGPRLRTPERTRQSHASRLLGQFQTLNQEYGALSEERAEFGFDPQSGLLLQFESAPDFDLKFESLDLRTQGIELLSVRRSEGKTIAVCYVPDGKLEHFINRIEEYRTQETHSDLAVITAQPPQICEFKQLTPQESYARIPIGSPAPLTRPPSVTRKTS